MVGHVWDLLQDLLLGKLEVPWVSRSFVCLMAGLLVSYVGDYMYSASLSMIVFQRQQSALQVATVFTVGSLASLFLLLVGGSIVVRLNAKWFMVVNDWARAALVLAVPLSLGIKGATRRPRCP